MSAPAGPATGPGGAGRDANATGPTGAGRDATATGPGAAGRDATANGPGGAARDADATGPTGAARDANAIGPGPAARDADAANGPAGAAAGPTAGSASSGGGEPSGVVVSPAAAASQAPDGPTSGDAQTWPDRSEALAECVGQATGAPELGREVVSEALIRHWVEAMGDHNPVYVSAEAARAAGYDDIIAPPTMLQAWVMRGLRSTMEVEARRAAQPARGAGEPAQPADPDGAAGRTGQTPGGAAGRLGQTPGAAGTGEDGTGSESPDPVGTQSANDRMMTLLDEEGRTSVVATNCEQHYERPLHVGERLVVSSVIEAVSDPKRTALGDGRFATTRLDFRALPDPGPDADPVAAFASGEPVATMRFRILKFRPGTAQAAQAPPARPPGQAVAGGQAGPPARTAGAPAGPATPSDQAPPCGQAARPDQPGPAARTAGAPAGPATPSDQAPPCGQAARPDQPGPRARPAGGQTGPATPSGPADPAASARQPEQGVPTDRPLRPRPAITEDNAFFFEGLRAGKLLIQRCRSCGTLRHPPLPACGTCRSFEWDAVEASGRAELYSFVVVHYPQVPAFNYPLPIGLLALEEGTRLVADLHQVDPADLYVGMPMVVDFVELDPELTLPFFRPADPDGGRD